MSTPDSRTSSGEVIVKGLLLLSTWIPTLYVLLAGDKEIAPLFGTISGGLDIVLLALFKEISSK
jgi:hypothetical protein